MRVDARIYLSQEMTIVSTWRPLVRGLAKLTCTGNVQNSFERPWMDVPSSGYLGEKNEIQNVYLLYLSQRLLGYLRA